MSTIGKTLDNINAAAAQKATGDIKFFGDGDMWQLIGKASSKAERWMKSTKALQIDGAGCLVQVSTQQGEHVAEAVCFVPGVKIVTEGDSENGTTARRLVKI